MPQHPRHRQDEPEQEPFAAGQGRQPDQPAEERGPCERRAITPPVGDEDARRGEQREQALGEQQAVDQPQVGVDGGQGAGGDRGPSPAEAFGDERGQQHGRGADQDRHELVVDVRRAAESRRDRQHHGVQRAVERARDVGGRVEPVQRLREAATTGDRVRRDVVEERIAAVGLLRARSSATSPPARGTRRPRPPPARSGTGSAATARSRTRRSGTSTHVVSATPMPAARHADHSQIGNAGPTSRSPPSAPSSICSRYWRARAMNDISWASTSPGAANASATVSAPG